MAESEGYKAFLVEAHENTSLPALLVPPLRQILFSLDGMASASQKAKRGLRVLAGFIKSFRATVGEIEIGIDPELGTADSGDLESDLSALAELGADPQRSGDVAEVMAVTVQSIAPLRAALIRKGMIYSPAHGDTAFTVPLFDGFMKRMIPDFPR
jgi:hypothetical protein